MHKRIAVTITFICISLYATEQKRINLDFNNASISTTHDKIIDNSSKTNIYAEAKSKINEFYKDGKPTHQHVGIGYGVEAPTFNNGGVVGEKCLRLNLTTPPTAFQHPKTLRYEFETPFYHGYTGVHYYSCYFRIPSGIDNNKEDISILFQEWQDDAGGPALMLYLISDINGKKHLRLYGKSGYNHVTSPEDMKENIAKKIQIDDDKWYHIVIGYQINFDDSSKDSWAKLWLNDNIIYDLSGDLGYTVNNYSMRKFGIYNLDRDGNVLMNDGNKSIEYDGITTGYSYLDVCPQKQTLLFDIIY